MHVKVATFWGRKSFRLLKEGRDNTSSVQVTVAKCQSNSAGARRTVPTALIADSVKDTRQCWSKLLSLNSGHRDTYFHY